MPWGKTDDSDIYFLSSSRRYLIAKSCKTALQTLQRYWEISRDSSKGTMAIPRNERFCNLLCGNKLRLRSAGIFRHVRMMSMRISYRRMALPSQKKFFYHRRARRKKSLHESMSRYRKNTLHFLASRGLWTALLMSYFVVCVFVKLEDELFLIEIVWWNCLQCLREPLMTHKWTASRKNFASSEKIVLAKNLEMISITCSWAFLVYEEINF